jgi:vacuolar protein sorting-associated protein 13A/C
MVFENLIASVINRFLADYVEELDSRQLNLNVTGGKCKQVFYHYLFVLGIANLADLQLKESALDDLNLPFKLKYGYISKLALKFSPMNPFASRTTADMEGLYIIVVPNKGKLLLHSLKNVLLFHNLRCEIQRRKGSKR